MGCKLFTGSAIHFWKLARIFYCVSILVATCALSIVIVLQLLLITNETHTYLGDVESAGTGMRYDNSRKYIIQDSVFVGDQWPSLTSEGQNEEKASIVCLASQASVDKLHHVIDSGTPWRGPMSVAVFTPDIDHQISVIYLQYLTKCFEDVMRNVSIHWVFPIEHPPEETSNISASFIESFDCSQWKEALDYLLTMRPSTMVSWRQRLHYPQNLMRNVARKSCASEYVLLTDVDLVPSPGMSQALSTFLASDSIGKCGSCAFVVATYEINKNSTLPGTKKELLEMVAAKKARTYRVAAHKRNQAATNTSAWQALPDSGNGDVCIAYQLPEFRFGYEPFYVSKDDVPPHDERFVGYGHTRNTQVFEMLTAGYTFYVLNNVFLVHLGMAQKRFNSSKRRQMEVAVSFKVSQRFLSELDVKYSTQFKTKSAKVDGPMLFCSRDQHKKVASKS